MNILLVCTGNTCRSPMAEALLDDAIDRSSKLRGAVKVKSAGTFACEGAEPLTEVVRTLEEYGLETKKGGATQFTPHLAQWADVILAMGKEQIEQMEVMTPDDVDKIHTLIGYANNIDGEPVGSDCDVPDPFGEELREYRRCASALQEAIRLLLVRLENEI